MLGRTGIGDLATQPLATQAENAVQALSGQVINLNRLCFITIIPMPGI